MGRRVRTTTWLRYARSIGALVMPTGRTDMTKKVYLTFDDGPLGGTDDVVAVLNNKRVQGTMFMVGDHVKPGNSTKYLKDAKNSRYVEVLLKTDYTCPV